MSVKTTNTCNRPNTKVFQEYDEPIVGGVANQWARLLLCFIGFLWFLHQCDKIPWNVKYLICSFCECGVADPKRGSLKFILEDLRVQHLSLIELFYCFTLYRFAPMQRIHSFFWRRCMKFRLTSPPFPSVCQLLDMKVFVDTDSDIRLIRRLKRDISQRGRDISGIIKQYNKFVKPAFEQYIEPTVQSADIVVPRGEWGCRNVAVRLLCCSILKPLGFYWSNYICIVF